MPVPHSESSPRGRAAAQSLVNVHDELREQLARVRELVAAVTDGSIPVGAARGELQRLALRQHDWAAGAYCSAHCLTVAQHHYGEDHEIFPLLRRGRPDLVTVLDRLESEHVTIHRLLERLDTALVALVTGADGARAELDHTLETFADVLLTHLANEEHELLGPMAEVFG